MEIEIPDDTLPVTMPISVRDFDKMVCSVWFSDSNSAVHPQTRLFA
jgi:hypothetical protein